MSEGPTARPVPSVTSSQPGRLGHGRFFLYVLGAAALHAVDYWLELQGIGHGDNPLLLHRPWASHVAFLVCMVAAHYAGPRARQVVLLASVAVALGVLSFPVFVALTCFLALTWGISRLPVPTLGRVGLALLACGVVPALRAGLLGPEARDVLGSPSDFDLVVWGLLPLRALLYQVESRSLAPQERTFVGYIGSFTVLPLAGRGHLPPIPYSQLLEQYGAEDEERTLRRGLGLTALGLAYPLVHHTVGMTWVHRPMGKVRRALVGGGFRRGGGTGVVPGRPGAVPGAGTGAAPGRPGARTFPGRRGGAAVRGRPGGVVPGEPGGFPRGGGAGAFQGRAGRFPGGGAPGLRPTLGAREVLALLLFLPASYFHAAGRTFEGIGNLRLLGFPLASGYRLPFLSHNFVEYWKRWNHYYYDTLMVVFLPMLGWLRNHVTGVKAVVLAAATVFAAEAVVRDIATPLLSLAPPTESLWVVWVPAIRRAVLGVLTMSTLWLLLRRHKGAPQPSMLGLLGRRVATLGVAAVMITVAQLLIGQQPLWWR